MEQLGKEYYLLKKLGEGGFAEVYKAKHIEYGYIRALRLLRAHVSSEENKLYKSFLRECKVLLRLGNGCHPNIVHIYQPRLVDGRALVEMDYIDGIDLRRVIEEHDGKVPVEETLRMVREIGSALSYCHHDIYKFCYDKGVDNLEDDPDDGSKALITPEVEAHLVEKYRVIHNDIHTGNIMRRTDGSYVLLDFGLAVDGESDVVGSSRMQHGAIEFKSPERSDGKEPTPQDDIYSFGCVIYAMLAGCPPFPVQTKGQISMGEQLRIYKAHLETPPPPIDRPDAPQWLIDLTMRCLEKKPADRYADGRELYADISKHLDVTHRPEDSEEFRNLKSTVKNLESENAKLKMLLKTVANDPNLDLKDFQMLDADILEDWGKKNVTVKNDELLANKARIVETLRNYGIEILEITASSGPTVTLYEIKPAPGIRISKIKSLEDDIAHSLADLRIRIIAPIPGKSTIGIEVPNANSQIVSTRTMLDSTEKKQLLGLKGDLEKMRQENDNLRSENDTLRKKNEGLEHELDTQKDSYSLLENSYNDLTKSNEALKKGKGGRRLFWPIAFFVLLVASLIGLYIMYRNTYYFWDHYYYDDVATDSVAAYEEPVEEVAAYGLTDLGLPSGTMWADQNEEGFYTYDEAVERFGDRLPTKEQWEELVDVCHWDWNGSGYTVTGPNGNTIYLPAAGNRSCDGGVYSVDSGGLYWSYTPKDSESAWSLDFSSGGVGRNSYYYRCVGKSVRLVQD